MSRCSPHQAAGELALAEKLTSLPGIAKALRDGEISSGQLPAAADIATPETEDETIEFVKKASSADLERQAAISRGKLTEERQAAHTDRYLAFKGESNSSTRIHGRLPYAEAKQLEEQLRKIADRLELGNPQRSSPAARMADSLVILTKHNPSASLHEHQRQQAKGQTNDAQRAARSKLVSPHSKSTSKRRTNVAYEHDPSETPSDSSRETQGPFSGNFDPEPFRNCDQESSFTGSDKRSTASDSDLTHGWPNSVGLETAEEPAPSIFGAGAIDYDDDPFPETRSPTNKSDLHRNGYETVGLFDGDTDTCGTDMFTDDPDGINTGIDASTVTIVQKSDTRVIIFWNAATGVVRYENGPPIDHPRLEALQCDAQLEIQHTNETGQPTGLITTSHNANWRQDRYLAYRDGPCRIPNCIGQGKTHAHHIFKDQTGRTDRVTDVRYMINLCNHNHNQHHDGKFEISGDPEGTITFTYPDGRQLHSPARTVPPKMKTKSVDIPNHRQHDKSA
jgi:hypothetical protein